MPNKVVLSSIINKLTRVIGTNKVILCAQKAWRKYKKDKDL